MLRININDMKDVIRNVRELISEDRIDDALSTLSEQLSNSNNIYDDIIMLKGKFRRLKKERLQQFITYDEYSRHYTISVKCLLNIIRDLIL